MARPPTTRLRRTSRRFGHRESGFITWEKTRARVWAGDIKDSDANPNHGTADSSMTSGQLVAGQIGNAIYFDGSNDEIDLAIADVGDTFTISAWIKPDSSDMGIQTIAANSSIGANTDGFRFFIQSGRIHFETGNGSNSGSAVTGTGVIDYDDWNFVAVEVDRASGLATIYLDGVNVTTDYTIRTDFDTSSTWEIGSMEGQSGEFTGAIDELRVTTLARSADWIKASYESQKDSSAFTNFGSEEIATTDGVNDAPTLTATGSNLTFTENGTRVDLFNAVTINTVENGQTIEQLVLTVTNVTDGTDELLRLDGEDITLTDSTSGTTLANGYGYNVSLVGTTATVTLTTTGVVSGRCPDPGGWTGLRKQQR